MIQMTSQGQPTTATTLRSNRNLLLGLTIVCFVLSILPIALINSSIAVGVLIFDIICVVLAITLLIQAKKFHDTNNANSIASLIIGILAVIIASTYLILIPIISHGFQTATCTVQTVVDPSECPSDYKLQSSQKLKQN